MISAFVMFGKFDTRKEDPLMVRLKKLEDYTILVEVHEIIYGGILEGTLCGSPLTAV